MKVVIDMTQLLFEWLGQDSLAAALRLPIESVSISTLPSGVPSSITLWHPDGSGIEIHEIVHEISDRDEVGTLMFRELKPQSYRLDSLRMPDDFLTIANSSKLAVYDGGDLILDCGVVVECSSGKELVIVAGNFPYTIAIKGVTSFLSPFDSEWPWEKYVRESLG